MNIQSIILLTIILLAFAVVGYRYVRRQKNSHSCGCNCGCEGCSGCDAKGTF